MATDDVRLLPLGTLDSTTAAPTKVAEDDGAIAAELAAESAAPPFCTLALDSYGSRTPAGISAVFMKVSWALLPIFYALNCLNFLDRTNLAFASIQMSSDLNLSPSQYGLGSGLFFLGYSCFQIPSQMILKRVGAPIWLGVIVSLWGLVATGMAGINGVAFFYFARLLPGVTEAGCFPGSWFYLSGFYPDNRITVPFSITDSAIMVSQVIGAPIAVGILSLDGAAGLRGWQWLFLLEGLPTLLLGPLLYFLLPRSPAAARWLSPEEASMVQEQVDACRGQHTCAVSDLQLLCAALRNHHLWHIAGVKFTKDFCTYAAMFWCAPWSRGISGKVAR